MTTMRFQQREGPRECCLAALVCGVAALMTVSQVSAIVPGFFIPSCPRVSVTVTVERLASQLSDKSSLLPVS